MSRWRVTVSFWDITVDAEDEGYALMEADSMFNFMNEARAEEIDVDEEETEA